MRKFLDNLNNLNEFRGRHQTLKIHVQEKLHTHNFLRGAGVQESGKPPTAARPPGGGFRDFSFLHFHAGFFRGFSRPLINHGGHGRKRRTRGEIHPKTAERLQNPVNFTWNRVKSWRFTVKSCKTERERGEIEWNSVVFIRRGSVSSVYHLIFGGKQKILRNFAKTLDNIYIW